MQSKKQRFPIITTAAGSTVIRIIRTKMILIQIGLIILLSASSAWPRTVTYTYDSLNRLEKAEYAYGEILEYTYDKVGNRLTKKSRPLGLRDVISILRLLVDIRSPVTPSVDINDDGKLGMQEVIYIMQRLAGLRD